MLTKPYEVLIHASDPDGDPGITYRESDEQLGLERVIHFDPAFINDDILIIEGVNPDAFIEFKDAALFLLLLIERTEQEHPNDYEAQAKALLAYLEVSGRALYSF